MRDTLRFTLLSEGPSDRALVPLLAWLLRQHLRPGLAPEGQTVIKGRLPPGVLSTPRDRLRAAVGVFPCDLLFLHRDADRDDWAAREAEIQGWLRAARPLDVTAALPVIPVRETEAWLLVDAAAIRRAAGNPNGSVALRLPRPAKLEAAADPKVTLLSALRVASGRHGRRLKSFDVYTARSQVGEHIDDPSCLRQLAAFRRLEDEVKVTCHRHRWV